MKFLIQIGIGLLLGCLIGYKDIEEIISQTTSDNADKENNKSNNK